ncbi:coiled-coil protein isoform X2 [Tasmannia lanceolata]|uniref:coiled-coil protein isoform X2 n=1 Tax=Tasmannia lanceolata TaxID=3420 RepID=UPI0040636B3D
MQPPDSNSRDQIPFFLDGRVIESSPPRVLFFLSLMFLQGGGMDLSRVGEKLLSSVRSARSLGLLPPPSDRPEVPARAVAAAAVARVIAGLPPHQRHSLPSSSEELISIYGSRPHGQTIEELEEDFYEEDFDPVRHVLEHIPSEEDDLTYFEKKATLRLAQLDGIAERLSRHVMEHHEEMVKGMQLVMEVEQDLKVANVISMNGRRHLTSSMHEVSRDLVVTSSAKKKQALLDMVPILSELRHAIDMRMALETHVEDENYFRAFQVLSEYLQLLDSFSELSAVQEMSRSVEVWLAKTLQKLDSLLLGVCQEFKEESYVTVVDAYALIGDIAGLAEKIQSFFMQEVLSETHGVLKDILHEDTGSHKIQRSRLTYSDLCLQIPESKFRQCLLKTLGILFKLMCSYYAIMSFLPGNKGSKFSSLNINQNQSAETSGCSKGVILVDSVTVASSNCADNGSVYEPIERVPGDDATATSCSSSPFDQLRNDTTAFVSQTLQRGRKNLWQLTTSRISVLLSCSAVCSTSTHQFLRNYEDMNVFILSGEAFSGVEAVDFRQRVKIICENYLSAFHRQNIYALRMVLEKETWLKMSPDTVQVISLAGLLGDGAPLIVSTDGDLAKMTALHTKKFSDSGVADSQKNGFANWIKNGNPFFSKLICCSNESSNHPLLLNGKMVSTETDGKIVDLLHNDAITTGSNDRNLVNGNSVLDDENEDLLADFIDEDSQLPSRISKSTLPRNHSRHWNNEEITAHTGSSLCLLRLMDKYARLMQKLEIVSIEYFKGICQLFEVFFHFIFETFGQRDTHVSGKLPTDSLTHRLRAALSRITQDCDQWIKPQTVYNSSSSPTSMNTSFSQMDVTPTSPANTNLGHPTAVSFGLKERCTAAETISLVAQILHRSKAHLQSLVLQNNAAIVEDFYVNLIDSVPDLTEHIHRTTARLLLHINGYADRVGNTKWDPRELGMEHNGYVDLLLGEFKHYKTRLAHGGIHKEVQDLLIEFGLENVAETLVEGLSRVKRCTDEGRALMSLDLQVLINGLQHFVSMDVKPKFLVVDTFIKAYYLPETEYVHWARVHPEFSRSQIVGLINLVATMKSWKRKARLEVLERIESGGM